MKKYVRLFFVGGSFAFLWLYFPEALKDNKVTLVEIATIGINMLCFIINSVNLISAKLEESDQPKGD